MANPVITPQVAWEDMLAELVGAGNLWNGGLVRLFKNNAVLGPATQLADLIIADFTGYADSAAVVWGTPGYLPDGTAVVAGDVKEFRVGATPTVYNTIYGWCLINAGATAFYFARKFDAPIVLSAPNQIIDVLPAYPAYTSV